MHLSVRVAISALTLAFGSELVWMFFKLWKRRLIAIKPKVLNEVLFHNELSSSLHCSAKTVRDKHICKNRFCAIVSIQRIQELIANAEETIDLAMYLFTFETFRHDLLRAAARGVKIRIIGHSTNIVDEGSAIIDLELYENIFVRHNFLITGLLHHKFCIIDGNKKPKENTDKFPFKVIITGSMNWTYDGFFNNRENVIITTNEIIIDQFQIEFERLWDNVHPEYLMSVMS